MREEIAAGVLNPDRLEIAISGLPAAIEHQFQQSLAYSLRSVINATGVILHTNLGLAPLCATAFDHVRDVALGYSNLEFDMAAGERGKRDVHVDRLFRRLLSEDTADVGAGLRPARAKRSSAEKASDIDRKSTRLNSSHRCISYAVFCLKKKKKANLKIHK